MFAAAQIGRVLAGFGLSAAGHQKKQEQSSVRHQPPKNPDLPKKKSSSDSFAQRAPNFR
jgi:hypothetical protein